MLRSRRLHASGSDPPGVKGPQPENARVLLSSGIRPASKALQSFFACSFCPTAEPASETRPFRSRRLGIMEEDLRLNVRTSYGHP